MVKYNDIGLDSVALILVQHLYHWPSLDLYWVKSYPNPCHATTEYVFLNHS